MVPGSTLIVAISALAIEADISPWLLLAAATLGAIMGDGASFWLGQRCHRQILQRWPLNRFPRLIARSEAFFDRYGAASVFLARFTAVVRAFVPLIAGIVQMPARQFYVANILSAIVWAPAHVFPGVVFGVLVSPRRRPPRADLHPRCRRHAPGRGRGAGGALFFRAGCE